MVKRVSLASGLRAWELRSGSHAMGGMDHSAMGHAMSDPSMAAAMERDMRTKFFIALPLTILTVLYSPMGAELLWHHTADLRRRHEPLDAAAHDSGGMVLRADVHLRCLPIAAARHVEYERADRGWRAGGSDRGRGYDQANRARGAAPLC